MTQAALNLRAFAGGIERHFRGKELRHRDQGVGLLAPHVFVDSGVRKRFGRFQIGQHIREPVLPDLKAKQSVAENLPIVAPFSGFLEQHAGLRARHDRQHEPLALEASHDESETFVLLPDQIARRDPNVVEKELCRVGRVRTDFLQPFAGKTVAVGGHDDQRDAAVTVAAGAHCGRDEIRDGPVADVEFRAVDHVVIAVAHRSCLQRGNIAPRVGFGNAKRANQAALGRGANVLFLQLIGAAAIDDLGGEFSVRHDRNGDTDRTAAHQFLKQNDRKPEVLTAAAVLGRQPDAEVTEVGQRGEQRTWNFAIALPLPHVGLHFPLHQLGNRTPHHFEFFSEWWLHDISGAVSSGRVPPVGGINEGILLLLSCQVLLSRLVWATDGRLERCGQNEIVSSGNDRLRGRVRRWDRP